MLRCLPILFALVRTMSLSSSVNYVRTDAVSTSCSRPAYFRIVFFAVRQL